MNFATIKYYDIANGPGVRTSVFVSGCRHHCPGCFNEVAWDFGYGKPFDKATRNEVFASCQPDYIAGISLLGGEPMEPENQPVLLELVRQVKQAYPEKNIWCFSGYLYDDLAAGKIGDGAVTRALLSLVDVLVDGEFILARKKLQLRFRGSENQRLIDLRKTEQAGHVVLWTDEKEGEKTCKRSV